MAVALASLAGPWLPCGTGVELLRTALVRKRRQAYNQSTRMCRRADIQAGIRALRRAYLCVLRVLVCFPGLRLLLGSRLLFFFFRGVPSAFLGFLLACPWGSWFRPFGSWLGSGSVWVPLGSVLLLPAAPSGVGPVRSLGVLGWSPRSLACLGCPGRVFSSLSVWVLFSLGLCALSSPRVGASVFRTRTLAQKRDDTSDVLGFLAANYETQTQKRNGGRSR